MNNKLEQRSTLVLGGVVLFLCLLASALTARGAAGTSHLDKEERLYRGQSLVLPDQARTLTLGEDGKLVMYGRTVRRLLWQSNTAGHPGAHYVMQDDRNLVVYDTDGTALWASATGGYPGSTLTITNGNLEFLDTLTPKVGTRQLRQRAVSPAAFARRVP
jgi:hypothetical protein